MKKILLILVLLYSTFSIGQKYELIEKKAMHFSLEQENDTIDFIVVDTVLNQKKPVFLWCQGSLPIPLFLEIENYGYFFSGGGVANFNYKDIAKKYHLVIISMPKTPIIVQKENLNNRYEYIPNSSKPNVFSKEYIKADYLENYVIRANYVLNFLKKQKWVSNDTLVIAGHSQGTEVATKLAIQNKSVSHLGLFSANPFGRIDQFIREARLDAQLGRISPEQADSIIKQNYTFFEKANNEEAIKTNPELKAWKTFSTRYYVDWLKLDIPIYLAYGTEDRCADLCDIIPLFFIEKGKTNLTIKRYIGLEHNFFELSKDGSLNNKKGHWNEVMNEFIKWIE